jgi:hypothetical protein
MEGQALKRIWIMGLLIVLFISISATASALTIKAAGPEKWQKRISQTGPLFAGWKDAQIHLLYAETDEQKYQLQVWVVGDDENLGYFVTSDQGLHLLEYGPVTPVHMLEKRTNGIYSYAGPGMHLYKEDKQSGWVNLFNGETLPPGEPVRRIPADRQSETSHPSGMPSIPPDYKPYSTDTSPDVGIAVMILHGLRQTVSFELDHLPEKFQSAGYLVYTVLPNDYYSVWAITGRQTMPGDSVYLEVRDVFAADQVPIYIRGDVPVNWTGSR